MNNKKLLIFFLITILITVGTCKKLEKEMMVTTGTVSNISSNSAEVTGEIVDIGTGASQHGHCYGKQSNVSISNSKTQFSAPIVAQNFFSTLTDLDPGTVYYIKAYISDNQKTVYSKEISFTTLTQTGTVPDIDGNIYNIIVIGTQLWLKENLKTTRLNDGTTLPLVTDDNAWINLTTPGYCWFGNDETTYKTTYGSLYNWYTVKTGKLCPAGWHVPTDEEWTTLTTYLGGEEGAGGKLKETGTSHWDSPNTGATNETGFTALPGGCRDHYSRFLMISLSGYWWSTSDGYSHWAWSRFIEYDKSNVGRMGVSNIYGFSVRCVMD